MESALETVDVKLTTPLVLEVLHRLRFDEKTAFRFFTLVGRREDYHHEAESYNKMIDILSSTKHKVKQFRIVCDLLDYMKRRNKRSVPVDVLTMNLRRYTENHLTHLQKFSKKKKIRVKTKPEINALNLLLDALCKCCLVEDAELMVARVKSKIKPDAQTYSILFFGWCRVRNPYRGMKVLQEMIDVGHAPDNFTYNTAIDTFCKSGMLKEARELLGFMKTNGSTTSSPTAKTYSIMMLALVRNDRMDESLKLLEEMIGNGCLPDVTTYKEIVEGMVSCGHVEAAYGFLEAMARTGYPPDIVTYNCFLKVLCGSKNREESIRLFEKMTEAGCAPSVQTYNILIEMFFAMGDPDGAFDAWDEMDRRGCARDTDTYCVMIEGLFGCNNATDAMFLLEQVIDRGMKLPYKKFDTFLMRLSAAGDLRAIQKLSEHMRRFYNSAMARRFALNQKRKSTSLRGK
ncbi:pentatricopeptide repeat-containing protein At1g73400, mitochondrial isoform X2 [Andrographis paniculata]|nr:pentatricopeptide repeat-containing protein At1g73400, mitochondrial isoform X2 [Andrographis paniculata]